MVATAHNGERRNEGDRWTLSFGLVILAASLVFVLVQPSSGDAASAAGGLAGLLIAPIVLLMLLVIAARHTGLIGRLRKLILYVFIAGLMLPVIPSSRGLDLSLSSETELVLMRVGYGASAAAIAFAVCLVLVGAYRSFADIDEYRGRRT